MNNDEDYVDQVRWAGGVLLGGLLALLPFIVGRYDMPRTLLVSAIAAAGILPFWRYVGRELNTRIAWIPLLQLMLGPAAVALWFSADAIAVYVGAYACTVSAIRFVTRWRDI